MNPNDILNSLSACWCEILANTLGGSPGTCCVTAGKPAIVTCCDGYAWVRLVGMYPASNFPIADNKPQNCLVDVWAVQVELGITRCAPQPCDILGPACCDAEAEATAILLNDILSIRQLFTCGCLAPLTSKDIVIGSVKAYGPEGNCNGVIASATIRSSL